MESGVTVTAPVKFIIAVGFVLTLPDCLTIREVAAIIPERSIVLFKTLAPLFV